MTFTGVEVYTKAGTDRVETGQLKEQAAEVMVEQEEQMVMVMSIQEEPKNIPTATGQVSLLGVEYHTYAGTDRVETKQPKEQAAEVMEEQEEQIRMVMDVQDEKEIEKMPTKEMEDDKSKVEVNFHCPNLLCTREKEEMNEGLGGRRKVLEAVKAWEKEKEKELTPSSRRKVAPKRRKVGAGGKCGLVQSKILMFLSFAKGEKKVLEKIVGGGGQDEEGVGENVCVQDRKRRASGIVGAEGVGITPTKKKRLI